MGVLVGYCGKGEASIDERVADLDVCVEVLTMPLGKRVTVMRPGDIDAGVAGPGADIHDAVEREPVPGRLTLDDRVGQR